MIVNKLTVDGRDYFLPDPVTELRQQILRAVQAGGGYVTIPPINGGPGLEILFSPGMPVLWAKLSMGDSPDSAESPSSGPESVNAAFDSL